MKVTISELSDDPNAWMKDWMALREYLTHNRTDLLLLPEMPFCQWIADTNVINNATKQYAVEKHEQFRDELSQLNATRVVYSRPVMKDGLFLNSSFVWDKDKGETFLHSKQLFPEEPHFYEETWFDADQSGYSILDLGDIKIGVLLCTEMWFTEYARSYGKQGIDLLLCPRATGASSVEQWVRCGQTLAVISGGYCLSANRSGVGKNEFQWGGSGWIAQPGDGKLLGTTSSDQPFLTYEIDLAKARKAKNDYPLYVEDNL